MQGCEGRRAIRPWIALGIAVPVLVALTGAAVSAARSGVEVEAACWILSESRVLVAPGGRDCPLRFQDRIVAVEDIRAVERIGFMPVAIVRDRRVVSVDVPLRAVPRQTRIARAGIAIVLAASLMAIPLFAVVRSRARAGFPFAVFYGAASTAAVVWISGRSSQWMSGLAMAAIAIAPASLAHLGMTFPRERRVIREVPGIVAIPYVFSAFAVVAGWFALTRDALLWPPTASLLMGLGIGAYGILLLSCVFSLWESESQAECARARVLCYGTLLTAALSILVFFGFRDDLVQRTAWSFFACAVALPLPIALAISRYNLFNLGSDARLWIGRALSVVVASGIVTPILVLSFGGRKLDFENVSLLFAVALVCTSVAELARTRASRFIEARLSPSVNVLREKRKEFERSMATLRTAEEVAEQLAKALKATLIDFCIKNAIV